MVMELGGPCGRPFFCPRSGAAPVPGRGLAGFRFVVRPSFLGARAPNCLGVLFFPCLVGRQGDRSDGGMARVFFSASRWLRISSLGCLLVAASAFSAVDDASHLGIRDGLMGERGLECVRVSCRIGIQNRHHPGPPTTLGSSITQRHQDGYWLYREGGGFSGASWMAYGGTLCSLAGSAYTWREVGSPSFGTGGSQAERDDTEASCLPQAGEAPWSARLRAQCEHYGAHGQGGRVRQEVPIRLVNQRLQRSVIASPCGFSDNRSSMLIHDEADLDAGNAGLQEFARLIAGGIGVLGSVALLFWGAVVAGRMISVSSREGVDAEGALGSYANRTRERGAEGAGPWRAVGDLEEVHFAADLEEVRRMPWELRGDELASADAGAVDLEVDMHYEQQDDLMADSEADEDSAHERAERYGDLEGLSEGGEDDQRPGALREADESYQRAVDVLKAGGF